MKHKVKYIQVSNIAPQATKDQISNLFSYVGKIEDIRLYPTVRDVLIPVQSRICFIRFQDRDSVTVAQHMTDTVFVDRAITVIPFLGGDIPDEKKSLDILHSNGAIPGLATDAKWPTYVTNHVCIEGAVLRTDDPKLAENGLPDYPNLPATTESYKVNEIRRTVNVDNINPKATAEDLFALGETVGKVKYIKMGEEKDGSKNCLIEFSELHYVVPAMQLHDKEFMGQPLSINHATAAILKPLCKSNEVAQAEVEEAMKRVRDVQSTLFNSNIDPITFLDVTVKDKFSPSRSRSRSRSRRRTRSKSHNSKTRRRTRSRSRKSSRSRLRAERSIRSRRHGSGRRRSHSKTKRSSRRTRSRSRSKAERSRKEKESKSKVSEVQEPNIDAIAELISKELEKTLASSKMNMKLSNKEEKPNKETKVVKSTSRSRSRDKQSSKSRDRHRSKSRDRHSSRSRDRHRSKSRDRHGSKSRDRHRSKSRDRHRSKSRDRHRSKSRDRHRSKSRDRHRSKSRDKHRSKSRDRHRSKSRDRHRSKSRDRQRSKSRDKHRRRSRSRKRSRSRVKVRRSRSHSKRSRSRSRMRKSRDRRSTNTKRRHSMSPSRKRKHRREKSRSIDRSIEKKERKKERKSPEVKKIARNYDEEDEMYIEDKKTESTESRKEEAIDMDISD